MGVADTVRTCESSSPQRCAPEKHHAFVPLLKVVADGSPHCLSLTVHVSTAVGDGRTLCRSDPASCAAKIIRSGNDIIITSVGPEGAVFVDGINLAEEITELRSDIVTLLASVTALQIADDLIAANVTALQAADAQQAVDAAALADQNDEAHAQLASTDALIAANVTTAQVETGQHSIAISQIRSTNSQLTADVAALNFTTANHAETLVSFDQQITTNRANSYREHRIVVVHGDPASFYALVLNLPWPRVDTDRHWGWFKVHRNVQMQHPAHWGFNVSRARAGATRCRH